MLEQGKNNSIPPQMSMSVLIKENMRLCGECQKLAEDCSNLCLENSKLHQALNIISIILDKHYNGLDEEARKEINKTLKEVNSDTKELAKV